MKDAEWSGTSKSINIIVGTLYSIFVSTGTMHKVPYSICAGWCVGGEVGRYLELSNRVQSSSSRPLYIGRVSILAYQTKLGFNLCPGVPVWGLTFGNISIHGGRVWKPPSKQPQGRDVNNNGEDDGWWMMDDGWWWNWMGGWMDEHSAYGRKFLVKLESSCNTCMIIMQMFELT